MNQIIENIKLDLSSLLNKRMLILFAVLLLLYIFFNMGMAFFIVPLIFAVQPFAAEELNHALLKKYNDKKVVSRYIFSFILLIATIIMTVILSLLFTLFLKDNITLVSFKGMIGMTAIYAVVISILYPLYFKSTFRKGNIFLYLSILVYALMISMNQYIPLIKDVVQYLETANILILLPVLLVISLFSIILSIIISSRINASAQKGK